MFFADGLASFPSPSLLLPKLRPRYPNQSPNAAAVAVVAAVGDAGVVRVHVHFLLRSSLLHPFR